MNVMERVLREKIDKHLTVENVSSIASKALGKEVKAGEPEVLTGGCWNRVIGVRFDTGEDLVFKINPEAENASIEREYHVLKYFADNTDMPVPEPYLIDSEANLIPGTVLVMKRLPGAVMHHVFSSLSGMQRDRITDEISHYVCELHKDKRRGFGGVELSETERQEWWPDFWLPRFDAVFKEVTESGLFSAEFLAEVRHVREYFPDFLDIGTESTVCHYDIWSGNVMIEMMNGKARVSGFIDIPGFCADYARELSFMLMFGLADRRFLSQYIEKHKLDPGFELRVNIYNLKMHMKHVTMYPDQWYYRNGAESCLAVIKKTIQS